MLYNQFEALRDDNEKIRVDLVLLTDRVAHLPSKAYMVKIAMGGIGILTAVTVLADNIRALFQ